MQKRQEDKSFLTGEEIAKTNIRINVKQTTNIF